MDGGVTSGRLQVPVTLELACALDEIGDLYGAAAYLAEMPAAACGVLQPLRVLVMEMLSALGDMGAVYRDDSGRRRIDRQAVIDFGVVCGGLSPDEVLRGRSLRQLVLLWRRCQSGGDETRPPARDFMTDMQERFPDVKGEGHGGDATSG